jgi:hypothetical protein
LEPGLRPYYSPGGSYTKGQEWRPPRQYPM